MPAIQRTCARIQSVTGCDRDCSASSATAASVSARPERNPRRPEGQFLAAWMTLASDPGATSGKRLSAYGMTPMLGRNPSRKSAALAALRAPLAAVGLTPKRRLLGKDRSLLATADYHHPSNCTPTVEP